MPKIVIYSQKKDDEMNIAIPLKEMGYLVSICDNPDNLYNETANIGADVVIIDVDDMIGDISLICRKIRLLDQTSDVQIVLILNQNIELDKISQAADAFIERPINSAILISTVNSHLRLKNHLDIFSTNNSELAKRFYQLQVLYDTSSKLAGTLNRRKLINIMNEGLEQSISYSLCSTLVINNKDDILLLINSTYPLTKRLEQALKLRAVITYKSMFEDNEIPVDFNVSNIKTEINYKKDNAVYDLEIMRFASIFSPISTQDKFFGTVEIMRDTELSSEDSTCFQTVVSQVSLPLESAILYEEIQEKNIKLVKLEKLKSEFVSIVSHELRTPLTSIKNALDIMLSGKTGELTYKMSNFLNMGKRNVIRLSGIINDLLDLSKIEAGKMEYRFEKTNLTEPLNLVFTTFTPMATDREITLNLHSGLKEAFVYADSQKIEQVVSNLVSNALKFTEKKGNVDIILEDYDEKYYVVRVKDSGIGISEENLGKVFDKFRQIESSLSRKVGGTGLGLPIAKEFIETHKGTIWVESVQNEGSTFNFILPKYSVYTNFLIELEQFYEKTKNANTNFAFIKIKTNKIENAEEYFKNDNKIKKIFVSDNMLYLITSPLNKNAFDIYLENLKYFISDANNDIILMKYEYCDFEENKELALFISDFEKEEM